MLLNAPPQTIAAAADCPFLPHCRLLASELTRRPLIARVYRDTFCLEGGLSCGRRMVAEQLGPECVPPGLFPGHLGTAKRFLAGA
ncbi:MAG: hypothetical protein HZB55_02770 [Deltaproteobacteria bacterium]|nr:hypothetical protein [Deltaproteobacteria bacterium]